MSRNFTESREFQSIQRGSNGFANDYTLLPQVAWSELSRGQVLRHPFREIEINPALYTAPFKESLGAQPVAWRVIHSKDIPSTRASTALHFRGLEQARIQLVLATSEPLVDPEKNLPISLDQALKQPPPSDPNEDRINFARLDQVRLKIVPPSGSTVADRDPATVLLSPSIETPNPLGTKITDLWSVHYRYFLAYTQAPEDPFIMITDADRSKYGGFIHPSRILVESVFLRPFRPNAKYPLPPHLSQSNESGGYGDSGNRIDLSWLGPVGRIVADGLEDLATWRILDALPGDRSEDS